MEKRKTRERVERREKREHNMVKKRKRGKMQR